MKRAVSAPFSVVEVMRTLAPLSASNFWPSTTPRLASPMVLASMWKVFWRPASFLMVSSWACLSMLTIVPHGLFERSGAEVLDCNCGADIVPAEEEDHDLVVRLVEGASRGGEGTNALLKVERGLGLHDLEEASGAIIGRDFDHVGCGVDRRNLAAEGMDDLLSGCSQGGKGQSCQDEGALR